MDPEENDFFISQNEGGFSPQFFNGREIAKMHLKIIQSDIITEEMLAHMIKFFGDFPLWEAQRNKPESWSNLTMDFLSKLDNWMTTSQNKSMSQVLQTYLKDPMVVYTLKKAYLIGFQHFIKELDPLTRSSLFAWTKPHYMPFDFYSDIFWLQWATTGNNGVITGAKGSGKTDFALLLCEIAKRNGWEIITNVKISDPGFENSYVSTFSELMEKVVVNALKYEEEKRDTKKSHTLILLDELKVGGIRKKTTMHSETLNFDQFEALTRKFSADVLLIWHEDREIPTEIYSQTNFLAKKLGGTDKPELRKWGFFQFWTGENMDTYYVRDIPKTNLHYDTRDIAPFILDISLSEILDYSNELDKEIQDPIDRFRAIRDFLIDYRNNKKRGRS